MDFASLKARIYELIGREPNAVCYELVTADINQEMRLRSMQTQTTLVAALEITLPTDFLSIDQVYLDTDPRRTLRQKEPQALRVSTGAGQPMFYAIVDGKILLDAVDGADSISLLYTASLPDLSADTDTNVVLTNHPAVYVYGALAHHSALIRDQSGISTYTAAYQAEMGKAKANDRLKGGPPPMPTVKGMTP